LNKKSPKNINKKWHEAHRMPKNPTLQQRIIWHLEHAKNCYCRPIPEKILEEININKIL
jgi:hypothetical protein